ASTLNVKPPSVDTLKRQSPSHFILMLILPYFFDGLSLIALNAALRGEQRKPPNLTYCAINTKAKLRIKIAKR
ncbi:hypothetical protein ACEV7W_22955, partial [Vibrio parahaemolyticus]